MKVYKSLGFLAFWSLFALHGARAQSRSAQPVQVPAELLPSQTLPVHITMATLQNFDTGSELLLGTVKAQNVPMSRMMVDVYARHNERMLHGQGIAVDLSRGSSKFMSFTLQTLAHLEPGDTVLVFVQRVQAPTGDREISMTGVNAFTKKFLQGNYSNSLTSVNAPADSGQASLSFLLSAPTGKLDLQPDHPTCTESQTGAKTSCENGGGRLSSFSCDPNTGIYSFSCTY